MKNFKPPPKEINKLNFSADVSDLLDQSGSRVIEQGMPLDQIVGYESLDDIRLFS
jgi:hypothetical protein